MQPVGAASVDVASSSIAAAAASRSLVDTYSGTRQLVSQLESCLPNENAHLLCWQPEEMESSVKSQARLFAEAE